MFIRNFYKRIALQRALFFGWLCIISPCVVLAGDNEELSNVDQFKRFLTNRPAILSIDYEERVFLKQTTSPVRHSFAKWKPGAFLIQECSAEESKRTSQIGFYDSRCVSAGAFGTNFWMSAFNKITFSPAAKAIFTARTFKDANARAKNPVVQQVGFLELGLETVLNMGIHGVESDTIKWLDDITFDYQSVYGGVAHGNLSISNGYPYQIRIEYTGTFFGQILSNQTTIQYVFTPSSSIGYRTFPSEIKIYNLKSGQMVLETEYVIRGLRIAPNGIDDLEFDPTKWIGPEGTNVFCYTTAEQGDLFEKNVRTGNLSKLATALEVSAARQEAGVPRPGSISLGTKRLIAFSVIICASLIFLIPVLRGIRKMKKG